MDNSLQIILKKYYCVIIITLVSAILIFKNLGNMYLWQDEACVALISQNVLKTGLPLVFDGTHWLTSVPLEHLKSIYVDTQTWLEYYIAAISFFIFRINTFSARFPFAIFGLIGVIFSYFFYKNISSKKIAIISMSLIAFSIPYILYARQCSFYAMIPLLNMMVLFFYLKLINNEKYAATGFVISNIILYYTFFAMFFIIFSAILAHFFIFGFYKNKLKEFIKAFSIVITFIFPSLFFFNIFSRIQQGQTYSITEFIIKIKSNMLWVNNYIFPFLILLLYLIYKIIKANFSHTKKILLALFLVVNYFLAFFLLITNNTNFIFNLLFFILGSTSIWLLLKEFRLNIKERLFEYNHYALLLIFVILNIIATAIVSDAPYFRYIYGSMPILIFFLGLLINTISNQKILVKSLFILFIIFTNLFSILPIYLLNPLVKTKSYSSHSFSEGIYNDLRRDSLKSDFFDYLYEITHDYDCSVEGIVKYLNQNARSTDVVKISYNDFPLQFYTKLRIINWKEVGDMVPDWIIPVANVPLLINEKFLSNTRDVKYDIIELDYPNLCYSNLPEPLYHNFRSVKNSPKAIYRNFSNSNFPSKVVIFKKRLRNF